MSIITMARPRKTKPVAQRRSAVPLNVDDLIKPEAVAELHRLADEVEVIVADFRARLAEPCRAAMASAEESLSVLDTGSDADDAFGEAYRRSGARRLGDALYVLSQVAGVAAMDVDPAWWAKEQAALGLA